MKYNDILELKKRMDFNLTEAETLVKLVSDAQNKGDKAQKDMARLRDISLGISKELQSNNMIMSQKDLETVQGNYDHVVGIDGSSQLVGGAGGMWYAPISVARIIFKGLGTQPKVDIFWAGIEEIDERDDYNVSQTASIRMLSGEAKAILDWGLSRKAGTAFIDGPLVDPPSYNYKEYILDRSEALKKCASNSLLIGCVKRTRDRYFIEYLKDKIKKSETFDNFPSDQHLMLYVFSHLRRAGITDTLFTKWMDLSSSNKTFELYAQNGLKVTSFFIQSSRNSQVLRIDVAITKSEDEIEIEQKTKQAAKAVSDWTFPGQDYPLPVFLAHDKCNIREGCAQVLYEDIITKSTSVDPQNQRIITQLR